jgi:hypothetical protein
MLPPSRVFVRRRNRIYRPDKVYFAGESRDGKVGTDDVPRLIGDRLQPFLESHL